MTRPPFVSLGCLAVSLGCLAFASCAPPVREVKSAAEYDEDSGGPQPSRQRALPAEEADVPDKIRATPDASGSQELSPPPSFAVPPVTRKHPQLEGFYEAVDELRAGVRGRPVRVLWLGDSHTAADFMTHRVREHLAKIGGDGGPGFVRLGLDGYRHGAVRLTNHGRWRKAPILPAQRTRVLDGVFGYGGIRTLPAAGAGASAELRAPREENLRWTVSYRLVAGAQLEVRLGGETTRLKRDPERALSGGIESTTFVSVASDPLSVQHVAGDPQVFGAFGEYETPGIVFDTVGINGARVATTLAWEPDQYVAQLGERAPDLLIVAFGTNEVFDQTSPGRYVGHTEQLVKLARQARPELPCWIVGAPDSATNEGTSKARVTQVNAAQKEAAESLGCAFSSAYELMGGAGSFGRWARERPAKARGDRIHLTIAGYNALGDLLAADLIEGTPLADLKSAEPASSDLPMSTTSSGAPTGLAEP